MRTSTPLDGLLFAGSASITLRIIFLPQPLSWNFGEKRGNSTTIRRKIFNQLAPFCRQKGIEKKQGKLWCLVLVDVQVIYMATYIWEGGARCFVGGFVLGGRRTLLCVRVRFGRRDGIRGWSVFYRMEDCIILFQEGQAVHHSLLRDQYFPKAGAY